MKSFNQLVGEQMETMDKLLYLQSELEHCLEMEEGLYPLQNEAKLESLQHKIIILKQELKNIQRIFEVQTEEVIRSYQQVM